MEKMSFLEKNSQFFEQTDQLREEQRPKWICGESWYCVDVNIFHFLQKTMENC